MLEIVKEATPSIVLLENTPTALRSSMRLILEQLSQDYDVAWGLIGASHVGYPHKCVARAASHGLARRQSTPPPSRRERFYCLCARRTPHAREVLGACLTASEKHVIKQQAEPRRTVPKQSRENAARAAALGNAIVPAAAKTAFELLSRNVLGLNAARAPILEAADLRPWGLLCGGTEYHVQPPALPETRVELVFDPAAYAPPPDRKIRATFKEEGLVPFPEKADKWPTPRHSNIGSCHQLTRRAMRDIATAVRFEFGTPPEDRAGCCSADWLDWLMGVPIGFGNEFAGPPEQTYVLSEAAGA